MAPFSPSPLPEDELFTAQFALEWGEQTFIRKLMQLTSLFSQGLLPAPPSLKLPIMAVIAILHLSEVREKSNRIAENCGQQTRVQGGAQLH